jgi:hypothetical protein
VYELSDDPITKAQAKQLQNTLISQISVTEVSVSFAAYKLNGKAQICLFVFK